MKDEFVRPFMDAVDRVIKTEAKMDIKPGNISLQQATYTSKDVTVMVGVMGEVQGTVLYGMDEKTAIEMVAQILKVEYNKFDWFAASLVKEICNIITSMASVDIEKLGYGSKITPPTLICGAGVKISTFNLQRLLIPFDTNLGPIDISAVLVDKSLAPQRLAI